MDDLVSVGVANSEGEAISLCALLESAGIKSTYRLTNVGAGAYDGWSAGAAQQILVRPEDAELAREVLSPQE